MTLIFCPSFRDVESALDWFEARGIKTPFLWYGPDFLIRGSGRR